MNIFAEGQDILSSEVNENFDEVLNRICGNGADGDVVISADTTLTRDMYYNNLTINAGKVLSPAGYKIFVQGTLTNNATIRRNGNNGGNGANSSYNGSAGGLAGVALPAGSLGGTVAGVVGASGSYYSGVTVGNNGIAVTDIGNVGVGGGPASSAGGLAGALTVAPVLPNNKFDAYLLRDIALALYKGSSGSGSGAGGSSNSSDRQGAGGGGSATPGGIIFISFRYLVNNGIIEANGGIGGNGGSAVLGNTGSGGGGGGGTGGVIVLVGKILTEGTINVLGGVGGTGANNGQTGNVGKIYKI